MKGLTGPIQPEVGDHLAKEWGPHINKTNGASVLIRNQFTCKNNNYRHLFCVFQVGAWRLKSNWRLTKRRNVLVSRKVPKITEIVLCTKHGTFGFF